MKVQVWQSFSCNNSSSYYMVARFKSAGEAATVAKDIDKFLKTHAKQKDKGDNWETPTQIMGEIEKAWGFSFGKSSYIDWGGGGGMEGDEPVVGVAGDAVVFYHGYCGGLDFLDTLVRARGGVVGDEGDGSPTVAAMLELADNAAGKKVAKQLASFFGQTQKDLEDWKPGPWFTKKSQRYYRMPYATVSEEVFWWTDGKNLGFHLPFNADEIADLKKYLEGAGIVDHRLLLCDDSLQKKLHDLSRIGRCPECKSAKLTLFEADASMPEDQLVCAGCDGMFAISAMLAHAPVNEVCKGRLASPCAIGEEIFAANMDGSVYRMRKTGKWSRIGKKGDSRLISLHTSDGKTIVATGYNTIRVTTDAGKAWTNKKTPIKGWLFGVTASPNGTLYIGCPGGVILQSQNGGKKWVQLKTKSKHDILHVGTASDDVLFACTRDGKIQRSKNAGKTWTGSATPVKKPLCRVIARSETSVVAVGDGGTIITTSDGKKWTKRSSGTTGDIEDLIIGNDNRLYAMVSTGDILVSKTGAKWETVPSGARAHMWGICATPSGTIYCVGDSGTVARVEGLDSPAQSGDDASGEPMPTVGKTFVFTGKLRGLSRSDATTRAHQLGGTVKSSVTRDLDYLVIGDEGSPLFGGGKKGSKMVTAEKLIAGGAPLKIISETAFSKMSKLDEKKGGGKKAPAKKAPAKKAPAKKAPAKKAAKAPAKKAARATGKAGKTVGKSFLFTGKLANMTRAEAKKQVTALGGVAKSSVTRDLDYLVIGDEGSPLFGGGKKGSKMVAAEKLIASGAALQIISEAAFMKMKKK